MTIGKLQNLSIREISEKDEKALRDLARRSHFKHRHLDWFPPFEWLGKDPFLGVFEGHKMRAALACPPDPPQTAWIRLLAVGPGFSLKKTWRLLWPPALGKITETGHVNQAALLDMQKEGITSKRLGNLLKKSGFSQTNNVVVLTWTSSSALMPDRKPGIALRPMREEDLPAVADIDHVAFAPLWRNSLPTLEHAHQVAAFATVAEINEQIVGYQISTGDITGGHLARLAVSPRYQNRGIGTALLHDLLVKFEEFGCVQVTVNTQIENEPSLKLYRKFGFQRDHQTYPVYERKI